MKVDKIITNKIKVNHNLHPLISLYKMLILHLYINSLIIKIKTTIKLFKIKINHKFQIYNNKNLIKYKLITSNSNNNLRKLKVK